MPDTWSLWHNEETNRRNKDIKERKLTLFAETPATTEKLQGLIRRTGSLTTAGTQRVVHPCLDKPSSTNGLSQKHLTSVP